MHCSIIMKTILILKKTRAVAPYIVDIMAETWRELGHRVIEHNSVDNPPAADVLFLHVDRTVVPDEFLRLALQYPVAVNGAARDISRRLYSTAMLTRNDSYRGPVIVKTNANYGGIPENGSASRLVKVARKFFPKEHAAAICQVASWRRLTVLNPLYYPIFAGIDRVPAGVWRNERLIVEKFLPEKEGGRHYVRYWTFFGDVNLTGRQGSVSPIVKFGNSEASDVSVEVPQKLHRVRRMLGLDYGRIDFVMHEGEPVVLDVNKTQSAGILTALSRQQYSHLSKGMDYYLKR